MKRVLLPLIAGLLVVGCQGKQSKDSTEEPFYIGLQMGVTYKMFLHEKQLIDGGIRYKFRTRVEYSSNTPTRINDWSVADCLKSTIDDYLVPALSRSGVEKGMPFLIRAVCGDMG